jgi:hypothetical protein
MAIEFVCAEFLCRARGLTAEGLPSIKESRDIDQKVVIELPEGKDLLIREDFLE